MIAVVLFLFACAPKEEPPAIEPPEELEIPALEGVDLEALYVEAVQIAISSDGRVPWAGHQDSLARLSPGCPDVYAGTYDVESDDIDEDAPGLTWYDYCQSGEARFGGFQYWENAVSSEELTDIGETSIEASRYLLGDGVVGSGDEVSYEFDGESSDAVAITEGSGYSRWTYSSLVSGTMTGTSMFPDGSETAGGWRTEMNLFYSGGDADLLEAVGNIYLFERRMQGQFDSVAIDIEFVGPLGAAPDDCALEPRGWIGVRDENAWWYDVVFEPRYDEEGTGEEYENDPYTACDGCGTLYVRGIEQEGVTVCPDLSFLWSGALAPPDPEDFALSLRETLEDP